MLRDWLQLSSVMCFASYCCGARHLLSLDFHRCADDGKFVLQLGPQLTFVLPSLLVSTGSLRFVTGRGVLGLILVTSEET